MSVDPPPGFYMDAVGKKRWWDGKEWGLLESDLQQSRTKPVQPDTALEAAPEITTADSQGPTPYSATALEASAYRAEPPAPYRADQPYVKKKIARRVLWIVTSGAALLTLLLLLTFGVERWEKVLEPEHPETFSTIEVETGQYYVSEDGSNPCWVGQYWYDCIDELVSSFNHACADRYIAEVSIPTCDSYGKMIDEMNAENAPEWATVSELGSQGRLSYSPVTEEREVSNDDYRPAKTREAVCVLWAFVECRWHEDQVGADDIDVEETNRPTDEDLI